MPFYPKSRLFKRPRIKSTRNFQHKPLRNQGCSNMWFIEQGRRNVHILSLKSIADVIKIDVKDLL